MVARGAGGQLEQEVGDIAVLMVTPSISRPSSSSSVGRVVGICTC
jgi:hypothetical protein